MTTWISRAAALTATLTSLSACDGVDPAGVLEELMGGAETENIALSQTDMAKGALTLFPPDGFCIDRNTLRQTFALMARCDTLGAPSNAGGAPVALITVSVTPLAPDAPLPSASDVVTAANLSSFEGVQSTDNSLTFKALGTAPARDYGEVHWRGLTRLDGHMLGIALYGPEDSRATSEEGREIVQSVIRRSSAKN